MGLYEGAAFQETPSLSECPASWPRLPPCTHFYCVLMYSRLVILTSRSVGKHPRARIRLAVSY